LPIRAPDDTRLQDAVPSAVAKNVHTTRPVQAELR
jgi:hypothetical protein